MPDHTFTPTPNVRRLAQLHIRQGVEWLNRNAPAGWQHHLFHVVRGEGGALCATPRFKSGYVALDIVSLAFEGVPSLAGLDGRITAGTIRERYEFDPVALGFTEGGLVTCGLLDELWLEALLTYAHPQLNEITHSRRELSRAA